MRFKWWQLAIVVAVSIGFVVLLYVVAEFGRLRLVAAEQDVRRAQVQLARVVDLYQLLMNAESGHRGYLHTGDPTYLEPLHRAEGQIDDLGRRARRNVSRQGRTRWRGDPAARRRRPLAHDADGGIGCGVPGSRPVGRAQAGELALQARDPGHVPGARGDHAGVRASADGSLAGAVGARTHARRTAQSRNVAARGPAHA